MSRLRWPALFFLIAIALVCACAGAPPAFSPGFPDPYRQVAEGAAPEPGLVSMDGAFAADAKLRTTVLTDPGELPVLKVASDGMKPLPLLHTDVNGRIAGFVADVTVKQTFSNPYDEVIEATYVFPLPENAAVYNMKMVIGKRVIEATVKERSAARRAYERARQEGYAAALLEEERPNVFTQSVANIEPGKSIEVVIQYVQDMTYDAGEYEFVFPMVVGPRYIPGAPSGKAPSGTGTYADTDRVPDASRITPPVVAKGERSGHDVSLQVTASAEGAVSSFEVPSHTVKVENIPGGAVRVSLTDGDTIPNRDFVLRYRVASERPKAILYATGKDQGHFSLIVQPPALDVESLVGKRELVFVVDVSGSMSGRPLALCKAAMQDALTRMRPVDTFNVITFAGRTGRAFPRSRPANTASIREALQYVDNLSAGGGTEMLDAIAASLSPDFEKGRHRYVFFLTDGFVGNEDEILSATESFVEAIEAGGQRARVFGFGTGSSPNRMLIEGLGKRGRGVSVYASSREDPERAVNHFYRYIDRSVLRDVRIDFGRLKATELYPQELPDLFASHPLIVHGRFHGALSGKVTVRAKGANGDVEIPVALARAPMDDGWPIQDLLWARSKIDWLERDIVAPEGRSSARDAITKLGVEHHLVTRFTSFVAVDRTRKVGDGDPLKMTKGVESPEDVDALRAGARVLTLADVPPDDDDGYGYEFSDDPLASGGFGPNDATIRVGSQRAPSGYAADRNQLDMEIQSAQVYAVQSRGPRGCNCDVVGGRGSVGPSGAAALALLLFVSLSRRRRGGRSGST